MGNELLDESLCDISAEMRRIKYNGEECTVKWCLTEWADRLDRARMKMENEMANLRKENAKLRKALEKIVELTTPREGVNSIGLQVQGEALTALATPRHLEAASLQDASAN